MTSAVLIVVPVAALAVPIQMTPNPLGDWIAPSLVAANVSPQSGDTQPVSTVVLRSAVDGTELAPSTVNFDFQFDVDIVSASVSSQSGKHHDRALSLYRRRSWLSSTRLCLRPDGEPMLGGRHLRARVAAGDARRHGQQQLFQRQPRSSESNPELDVLLQHRSGAPRTEPGGARRSGYGASPHGRVGPPAFVPPMKSGEHGGNTVSRA